ncbi:MAG: hypothetical protein IPI67_34010 [Myxococcales bacterium]|nr:hypothetical protein [Myxococcales bacterium]
MSSEVEELDLLRLDRQLGRAVVDWARWRRRLRRGAALEQDPFATYAFISRLGYESVRDLPEHDPLRAPMLRWLYRLVDDRANLSGLVAVASARAVDRHPVDSPEHATLTLAEILQRVLRDRDVPRSAEWLARYLELAGGVAELERRISERRSQIAEQLKLEPDEVELPTGGLYEVAEHWLAATDDRASEFQTSGLHAYVELSLGLDAPDGWPARLSAESLAGLFRDTRLLQGLPLEPGPLPAALAPASFARALSRLGAAFADALAPRDQPFVVAHDAFGLRRLAHGALLGGLVIERAFLTRALGLGSARAADAQRVMARVILLETRARALRLLLRRAAQRGERAHRTEFEELTARVLSFPLRSDLAGAVFVPRRDEGQRFAAPLLAASHTRALIEDHERDWYRNPRAVEQLRAEASLPPLMRAPRAALDEGSNELRRTLFELLG